MFSGLMNVALNSVMMLVKYYKLISSLLTRSVSQRFTGRQILAAKNPYIMIKLHRVMSCVVL